MRLLAVVIAALVMAGCFGGDDEASRTAEETAEEWVTAINEGNYERACDLSVISDQLGCIKTMKAKPFGEDLKVEGFYLNRSDGTGGTDGEGTFALSSSEDRKPRSDGWTAYAPSSDGLRIEKQGNEYFVHYEVSIIK